MNRYLQVVLTIGVISSLLFIAFRPKLNSKFKRSAAILGLVVFAAAIVVPKYNDYLLTRPIKVSANSNSFFDDSLNQDWKNIKEKLEINDTRMNDFRVEFEKDGKIKTLHYQLIGNKNSGFVLYYVDLNPSASTYEIRRATVGPGIQYQSLVSTDQFFRLLLDVDKRVVLPQREYPWYAAFVQGSLNKYNLKDSQNLMLINKHGVKNLDEEQLPIEGLSMTVFSMVERSDNSASSVEAKQYVLGRNM